MQTDLFAAEQAKEAAINAAARFADPDWSRQAELALIKLCRRGQPFTTDGLWYLLAQADVHTPENRAMGNIITQATKDGWIRPTNEYRKSTRPECHRRPLAVWLPTKKGKLL